MAFNTNLIVKRRAGMFYSMVTVAGDTLRKLSVLSQPRMRTFQEIFLFINVAFHASIPDLAYSGRYGPVTSVTLRTVGHRKIFFLIQCFPMNTFAVGFKNIGRMAVFFH